MKVSIEQLIVYPVKSLRGIEVQQWPLTAEGLLYDRHWMLVMPNGRFVTQRQLPRMCLIDTAIDGDTLVLSCTDKGQVSLPLNPKLNTGVFNATIWRDDCDVAEASSEATAWLNQVLQPPQPLRLVAMANGHQRVQSQPERFGYETHTRFADAAPFLIANRASLDSLNAALTPKGLSPVDMRRFRPNIVISGLEAFAEHGISLLQRQDGLGLELRDHCERCVMTTINPDTAEKHPAMEPYSTLATLNSMPGKPQAAAFAVNATLSGPEMDGTLACGETLHALNHR